MLQNNFIKSLQDNLQKQLILLYHKFVSQIILKSILAIQYDKDNGEWGGFANDIYNSIKLKGASKESSNFFKMFDNGDASSAIAGVLNTSSVDEYAKSLGLADESLIKFLKDTDS